MSVDLRVLSLGAGVQSTTLLLMALDGEIERPDCAIFADTGWEPAAVYRHLDWLQDRADAANFPIYRVSAGNIRHDSLHANPHKRTSLPAFAATPARAGPLLRKCTAIYKLDPITQKVRELLGVPPKVRVKATVEQWLGLSLDEVYRMKDPRRPWQVNRYPLIDLRMTRWDCLLWVRARGYPEPPKSACIGCPFHNDRHWRQIRDESPEEWVDAVDFDRQIRHATAGAKYPVYLHRSLKPLDQVDLSTPADKGQMSLFDDFTEECEGMCGV